MCLTGMTKTEVTTFGTFDNTKNITLGNQTFKARPFIEVLGVLIEESWSLRRISVLNKILPRPLHCQVIHVHFISHLRYASPIWSDNLGHRLRDRLSAALNRLLR